MADPLKHVFFDSGSITQLYSLAASKSKALGKKEFILPMIEDVESKSPLDLIFDADEVDINSAFQFFRAIQNYPFLHSGPLIARVIPKAIDYNVPGIDEFLDSRFKSSLHLVANSLAKKGLKKSVL